MTTTTPLAAAIAAGVFGASALAGPVTLYNDQATFDAAATTALVVTFEEPAWDPFEGATIFSDFTFAGITFTPLDSFPIRPNLFISVPGQSNFCCPPKTRVLSSSGNENIQLTFHQPPTAAGFLFWANQGDAALFTVTLVDDSVHTFTNPQPASTIGFVGFTAEPAIRSIEWLADFGEVVNTGIDDLRTNTTPCPADLDGDGMVGAADLAALLAAWNGGAGDPADLDGDGTVGAGDLAVLLAAWGPCD